MDFESIREPQDPELPHCPQEAGKLEEKAFRIDDLTLPSSSQSAQMIRSAKLHRKSAKICEFEAKMSQESYLTLT